MQISYREANSNFLNYELADLGPIDAEGATGTDKSTTPHSIQ